MDLILLLLRLFLAGILGLAGAGKLMDLKGGEAVMSEFGVPPDAAKPAAISLSVFEIVLAAALLSTLTSWAASVAAFLLMLVFIGGMLWQIAKGRAPQCHCFGQLHSEPVSKKSVIRNVFFAFPALILAVAGPANQGFGLGDPEMNSVQNLFGILTFAAFVAVLLYLRKISEQQQQVLRRIDLLEFLSTEGNAVERNDAGDPQDSMPIGSLFPDFALSDLSGNTVTLNDVLTERPVVFLFVDPNCVPCGVLLPEIERWEKELRGTVDIVFVSNGSVEDNVQKFGTERYLLLQKGKELGERVFAKWTPSALLVNAEGKVASHLAIGDVAIRKLFDGIKQTNFTDSFSHIPLTNGNGYIPRKIGEFLPEFEVSDIKGNQISKNDLIDKRTLITFWSPNCPHCRDLMDELRIVDREGLPDDTDLIIFSQGDSKEISELNLRSPIVIDKGSKVSAALGALGTPSAVLVDRDGRFATETAVGGRNIWSLVRRDKVQ